MTTATIPPTTASMLLGTYWQRHDGWVEARAALRSAPDDPLLIGREVLLCRRMEETAEIIAKAGLMGRLLREMAHRDGYEIPTWPGSAQRATQKIFERGPMQVDFP